MVTLDGLSSVCPVSYPISGSPVITRLTGKVLLVRRSRVTVTVDGEIEAICIGRTSTCTCTGTW